MASHDPAGAAVIPGFAMMCSPAVTSAPPGTTVTWNPLDKAVGLTLSSGNLQIDRNPGGASGYLSVRGSLGKSSGKHYYEDLVSVGAPGNYDMIGVATFAESLTNYVAFTSAGWAYYEETGVKTHSATNTAYGSAYTSGDVIGIALDMDSGKVWFSKNGVWQASGNPAAGTGEAFSGIAGTIYPMVSLFGPTTPLHRHVGRFRTADFSYSPPAGFSPWGA